MSELLQYFFLPLLGFLLAGFVGAAYLMARQRSALGRALDLVTLDVRRADDKEYYKQFLGHYFSRLGYYVERARKEVLVFDYLAHHRAFNAAQSKELVRGHEQYFRTIESQVLKHDIAYIRVMQLPLGEATELSRDQLISRCVELMFVETLEHIKRMHESPCSFKLYILGTPLRPYSYMIADKRYLLSEYDRYNRAGVSLPDHLIVNSADSGNSIQDAHVRLLIGHHLDQAQSILKSKEPVSLGEIREAVLRLGLREIKEFEVSLELDQSGLHKLLHGSDPEDSDLAIKPRAPEQVENILKGYRKKKFLFSPPNPEPEADARGAA